MGKFPNSEIHNKYSDWHWGLIKEDPKYRRLYVADIDRLWIEYNHYLKTIIAVFDIKWQDSTDTGYSSTEKGIYDWFEQQGAPVFIVFISKDFTTFSVHTYSKPAETKTMTSRGYADWLLSLRNTTR